MPVGGRALVADFVVRGAARQTAGQGPACLFGRDHGDSLRVTIMPAIRAVPPVQTPLLTHEFSLS